MHELRKMLCQELDKVTKKGEISNPQMLDIVDKLTHSIKSIDTIMAMEDAGYSNDDYSMRGGSYARGRGSNARRDTMGRYADDYSMRGSRGNSYRGNSYNNSYGYSRGMDNLMVELGELENEMQDEDSKQMIRKWMREAQNV